jgi:hypothetical protein
MQRSLLPTEIIIGLKQQQLQLSEECAFSAPDEKYYEIDPYRDNANTGSHNY